MNYYYNKRNKFSHKFVLMPIPKKMRLELLRWVKENCGLYNKNYIYWGLKTTSIDLSGFEIYFKSKEIAMAFKLRW